jgi:hypothetical protein
MSDLEYERLLKEAPLLQQAVWERFGGDLFNEKTKQKIEMFCLAWLQEREFHNVAAINISQINGDVSIDFRMRGEAVVCAAANL